MAERQGFEPWKDANPCRFSRPVLSTTQPPLPAAQAYTKLLVLEKGFSSPAATTELFPSQLVKHAGFVILDKTFTKPST